MSYNGPLLKVFARSSCWRNVYYLLAAELRGLGAFANCCLRRAFKPATVETELAGWSATWNMCRGDVLAGVISHRLNVSFGKPSSFHRRVNSPRSRKTAVVTSLSRPGPFWRGFGRLMPNSLSTIRTVSRLHPTSPAILARIGRPQRRGRQ